MATNIKSNKKYLLLIPLVVSLIMLTFFSAAHDEIIHEMHLQKYQTVQRSLNFIVSVIDHFVEMNDDWERYDYNAILAPLFTEIDEASLVRVELFDHNLNPLSEHTADYWEPAFDLLSHDEFVRAVRENDDRGELTIMVDDGQQPPFELFVYFKKIPTGDYDNKLIAVCGVSRYAIDDYFAPWLIWGVVGMVSMTMLLQLWMVLYISKLSDAERRARRDTIQGEKGG